MKETTEDIREWVDKLAASWAIAVAKGGVSKLQFESDAINFVEEHLMDVEKLLDALEIYDELTKKVAKDTRRPQTGDAWSNNPSMIAEDAWQAQDKVKEIRERT